MNTWEQCKQAVMNLTADYEKILKPLVVKSPESVYKQVKEGGSIIRAELGRMYDYEVTLLIKIPKNGDSPIVQYIAWNTPEGVCFKRDTRDDFDMLTNSLMKGGDIA